MKKEKNEKNLYDFDYESKEEKKMKAKKLKEKKRQQKKLMADEKKSASKQKKGKEIEQNKKRTRKQELKAKYDDEIIIGVTQVPNQKNIKPSKNGTSPKKAKKKRQEKSAKQSFYDEVEKRKAKKIRARKLKIIAIIILIIAAIIATMLSPLFNIKKINVLGNSKLTKEEIISLSGINIGENLFTVMSLKTSENLKQSAYVDEAKIIKTIPDTITIDIKERIPCYMLEYGNGYGYVNSQGYILELTSIKKNLPILTGISTSKENYKEGSRLNESDLVKLEVVIKIMNSAQSIGIKDKITAIDVADESNYTLQFDGENKVAYLGDCSNIETRMLYLSGILDKEKDKVGEIFVNMNLNTENAFFREDVKR